MPNEERTMSDEAANRPRRDDVRWVDVYYCELAQAAEPIIAPVTKVGGAPVFLQPAEWPVCRRCQKPMQFLAQFRLDEPLALARQYQMAYIFMCRTCDESWDPYSGVNVVLLQPASTRRLAHSAEGQYPNYGVTLTPGREPWVDRTDSAVDEDLRDQVELKTKLGGAPGGLQYADQPTCPRCEGPTRFAAELEAFGEWDGSRARYVEQNFGDSGSSYLFLCEQECGPQGAAFLWQNM
jgi:hypothetical protein